MEVNFPSSLNPEKDLLSAPRFSGGICPGISTFFDLEDFFWGGGFSRICGKAAGIINLFLKKSFLGFFSAVLLFFPLKSQKKSNVSKNCVKLDMSNLKCSGFVLKDQGEGKKDGGKFDI